MKTLILMIFVVLVVSGIIWKMRKSQAAADLARRKSLKSLRKQHKEVLTPELDMTWPVIIRPVSGRDGSGTGSESEQLEEPSMTAIEYEPPERMSS